MSVPTTKFASGVANITATSEASGRLLELNAGNNPNRVRLGCSGTMTSVVAAIRGRPRNLTQFYPLPVVNLTTGLPVATSLSITLVDSTNQLFAVDCSGCDAIEVWAVSGTPTSLDLEAYPYHAGPDERPIVVSNTTSAETHSGDITLLDAASLVLGTGSDVDIQWDGTNMIVAAAADDSLIEIGDAGTPQLSFDLKWYGNAAAGAEFLYFDASASLIYTTGVDVQFKDNDLLVFGDGAGGSGDINLKWDGTDLIVTQAAADSNIKWGVSGAGINHIFYGDTATRDMSWDQTNDQLLFADNAKLAIGSGAGAAGDIVFSWNGTKMLVAQLTADSAIEWGVDGAGIDMKFFGDTASAYCLWDQSADQLILGGVASVSGLRVATSGATAITTTRAVTKADSGGTFTVNQGAAYTITVATPAGAGERYLFQCVAPGANDVSIVATGCTFEGTITIDGATIPATGSTLKFASGAAILGDNIELISTSTTKFLVRAIGSGAGGITIA